MTQPDGRALQARVLLDAIGGLVGFIPERSLVLVAFDADGSINSTMRHDLLLDPDGTARPEFVGVIDNLATIFLDYDAEVIVAVVIEDRFAPDSPEISALVDTVAALFDDHGGLAAAYAIGRYAAGERWHTVLAGPPSPILVPPPTEGVLADPSSSPTALDRAVRRGRPVFRTRSEMCELLVEKAHLTDTCCAPANFIDSTRLSPRERAELLEFAHRALVDVAGGSRTSNLRISCDALTRWHRAITDLQVRDALLALAITDLRGAAERMWRELAQLLRGSGRASAATMLAHLHYIAGEGAFAGIALDVALGAKSDWSFAVLLDRALRAGVRPNLLWDVIGDSYRVARDLGVTLPEPTLRLAS